TKLRRAGLRPHGRRDAVRREHDERTLRHLVGLLHEDRTAARPHAHDVLVVHALLAHVDRGPVLRERLLARDDRPVDPGAVTARSREEDTPGGRGHGSIVGRVLHRPARAPAYPARVAPLSTTAENPVPVRTISRLLAGYIDKLG